MKNKQSEITVLTNGGIDLSLLPSDVLDLLVASLEIAIEKIVGEDEENKN